MSRSSRRSVYDIVTDISGRDDEAKIEVAGILSVLPEDHPARMALAANRPTIELSYLVPERPDMIEALNASWMANYRRLLDHTTGLSTSAFFRNNAPAHEVDKKVVYCRHCHHWAPFPGRGPLPRCWVQSACEHGERPSGCVQYEREPGSDDVVTL